MALLILALLQRIFLMSSLMLLLVWLIFFMVLIQLLPICLSTEGLYCSRCVYYGKHQSFQATAGFRDYAPNAYSSSNGWSVFTNDQIKEMTRKVSAEVDLVHQQTQNQRYGSSHIGATAKDISNVVTDAASGVVDIFHGIDKAVADTWNNFWKDGKADGIGSNLSRK